MTCESGKWLKYDDDNLLTSSQCVNQTHNNC